jgi:hypothetical protein
MDYFSQAVEIIVSRVISPVFFVFSDDINWCHQNIRINYPLHIISHEYAGEKFADYLKLMTLCKHYIIPNSTFAWWGAWLNPDPEKIVIAPKQWFKDSTMNSKDLVPDRWIKI